LTVILESLLDKEFGIERRRNTLRRKLNLVFEQR
jgi:hypothetical protein